MIRDSIVDEVRAIREQLGAQFGFDISKIFKDAQERQASSLMHVVSFQRPNPSLQATGVAMPVPETSKVAAETAPSAEL